MANTGPIKMPQGDGPLYDAIRDAASAIVDTLLVPAASITDSGAYVTNANWTISSFSLRQMMGPLYYLSVVGAPTSTITVPTNGNITDSTMCTVIADYRPPYAMDLSMGGTGGLAGGYYGAGGTVVLSAVAPGTTLAPGNSVQLAGLVILPLMPA